jgi:hypothetical protein
MTRRRRLAIGFAALLVLYALVGYLIVPRVVSSQLVSRIEALTGRQASVAGVAFDPFRFRLQVEGFALPDAEPGQDPVFAFDSFRADLGVLSLLLGRVVLEEVALVNPRISASIDETGALNLMQIVPAGSEESGEDDEREEEPAPEEAGGFVVEIQSTRVERGWIRLRDLSQTPTFEAIVEPLDVELTAFTTRSGADSPYSLSLRLGEHTHLSWQGTLGLDPLHSSGEIQLRDFALRLPWDFFSDRLRFEVREGALDVDLRYALELGEAPQLTLEGSRVALRDLDLRDPESDVEVIEVSAFSVESVDLKGDDGGLRRLAIGEVVLDGARVELDRGPDGEVRLLELFATGPEAADGDGDEASVGTSPPAQGAVESATSPPRTGGDGGGSEPEIRVDRVAVRDVHVNVSDRSLARPLALRLAPISLTIEGYSNAPESELSIDFATGVGDEGRVGVTGPLRLDPLSAQLAIAVEGLAVGDLQPFAEDVARLDVPSGALSAALDVDFAASEDAAPRIAARGRLQLDDLIMVDRSLRQRFLEWKSVRVEGLDFRSGDGSAEASGADSVAIEEIALAGVRAHVVVGQDGRSNLEAIFGGADVAESGGAASGAMGPEVAATDRAAERLAPRVEIGRITLEGVGADFDDRTAQPAFAISLDDLSGSVAGLSSENLSRADVALSGRIDDVAPVRVEGQINPLSGDAYTDIGIEVTGVSLPAFTPYAGRYVGYGIERGKLRLDLEYKLNARHLEAKNLIELKQFDFGRRVESDVATSLPVPLALTLLRDASGDIMIQLPVEGNLDDPSFNLLQLLRNTFVNLITRVATSPFSAVSGLLGVSRDDLANVDFASGSDRLSDAERAQLEEIAALLAERPSLRLDVRGRADPEVDRPGLRRARVLEEVRLSAFEALSSRRRRELGDPTALELDADEQLEWLERLHRERVGGRVRDLVPDDALPPRGPERVAALTEAALASLAETVSLEPADWRALARRRAAAVRALLLEAGEIPEDRVFLVDVEVGPSGAEGRVPTELALRFE